jgi:phage N-6-adenine-methyltransferase
MTAAQQTIELPESVARQALGAASCSAGSVHFSSASDDWPTPQDFFDRMNALHGPLELDVCASPENAKCPRYYTREDDGLAQPWTGRCWMNPPYGRTIGLWMRKAYEESQRGALVVCLVPARTDTARWHDYATKGQVTFIRGRLKFGGHVNSAPFPSATVVFLPNKQGQTRSEAELSATPCSAFSQTQTKGTK